jgi:DNA-3-methyladenine glycosylase II
MPALKQADRFLADCDPDFASLIARIGPSRLNIDKSREPYQALMNAVAHQQLHGNAAKAILGRVVALFPDHPFPPADLFLAHPEAELRACGLSAAKFLAMRDIAEKTVSGLVPSRAAAARMENEALIERLTALRGVGRWTVEMLLIFSLGRPDVLPIDDFGVREGYRKLKKLEAQPKPKALAEIGLAWSPYRSTAAWYLWRASEQKESAVNS